MGDWRDHAACRGSTDLFFPPCAHYRQPEGATCESCGHTVDRTPRPTDERWSPDHAGAICAACPVRIECLTEAISNGERHGIWGGAGGYVLRALARARRRTDHDYRPDCDCEACQLMTDHLNGRRIDGNTPGITHGLPGNRGRGCRCAPCALSGTITGKLLIEIGWQINDWWATTGLPTDPDAPSDDQAVWLGQARQIAAHRIATNIRARLDQLDQDIAWLRNRLPTTWWTSTPNSHDDDRLAVIAGYNDPTVPFSAHLNIKRATTLANALDIDLAALVNTPDTRQGRRVA